MDNHEKYEAHERKFWEKCPYGEYLNAVDETLEAYYGITSDQDELESKPKNTPPVDVSHTGRP